MNWQCKRYDMSPCLISEQMAQQSLLIKYIFFALSEEWKSVGFCHSDLAELFFQEWKSFMTFDNMPATIHCLRYYFRTDVTEIFRDFY